MDVLEMISLTAVLLLALYGCAQLMLRLSARLLRPRTPQVTLMLTLSGAAEDTEQQIRFAKELARQLSLPLVTQTQRLDDDARRIAQVLLSDENEEISEYEALQG